MGLNWKDKFKAHRIEIIIVGVFLLVAISFVVVSSFASVRGSVANIKHRNETILKVDLANETNEREIVVIGDYGEVKILVRKNEIKIEESNCPSQFCVHLGWVKAGSKPIICAYNGISITFSEDSGSTAILG